MPEPQPVNPERLTVPPPERVAETVELHSPEHRPPQPVAVSERPVPYQFTPTPGVLPVQPTRSLTPLQQEIEHVLEEGLADLYRSLTPPAQQQFKERGEVAALQLSSILQRVKFKLSDILKVVREWLQSIPGLNKYFVEQTAKIKADKLLKLH